MAWFATADAATEPPAPVFESRACPEAAALACAAACLLRSSVSRS